MTEAERILRGVPSLAPWEFEIPATTTNETFVDIPTKLRSKQAWHIVGIEWMYQNTDPTVPLQSIPLGSVARQIQLHRNTDSELMLRFNDLDCIFTHLETQRQYGNSAVVFKDYQWRYPLNTITTSEALRVMWRTGIDDAGIATTASCRGRILYHLVSAPDDGRTKHGDQLRDL